MNLPLLLATAATRATPQQADITVAVIVTRAPRRSSPGLADRGRGPTPPEGTRAVRDLDALPVVSNPVASRVSVAVTVAGRPGQEAFSVRVRIANTGKRSFAASNWASPIYVEFGTRLR